MFQQFLRKNRKLALVENIALEEIYMLEDFSKLLNDANMFSFLDPLLADNIFSLICSTRFKFTFARKE